MRVLACDGIHEDGLALFRAAGWDVEVSDPVKDPAAASSFPLRPATGPGACT